MREQFEQAILDNSDDVGPWSVYADWLQERGDPRGELMNVQIALEDESRDGRARAELKEREEALLEAHQATLLGPLADRLLNAEGWGPPAWSFRRGQLHTLTFRNFGLGDAQALRAYLELPGGIWLRELLIHGTDYDDEGGLEHLVGARLAGLRHLVVGDPDGPCHTEGEAVAGVVSGAEQLEVLGCYAHRVDTRTLFGLALPRLRELVVHHVYDYPLEVLVQNPTLGALERLDLFPHGLEYGDDPYLTLESIQALATPTSTLTRLRHLRLTLCAAGDDGVRALVASPLFKQLTTLGLHTGEITDAGAAVFVEAGVGHLESLDLDLNSLTEVGVAQLTATGVALSAKGQSQWGEDREYLFYGDIE